MTEVLLDISALALVVAVFGAALTLLAWLSDGPLARLDEKEQEERRASG